MEFGELLRRLIRESDALHALSGLGVLALVGVRLRIGRSLAGHNPR